MFSNIYYWSKMKVCEEYLYLLGDIIKARLLGNGAVSLQTKSEANDEICA